MMTKKKPNPKQEQKVTIRMLTIAEQLEDFAIELRNIVDEIRVGGNGQRFAEVVDALNILLVSKDTNLSDPASELNVIYDKLSQVSDEINERITAL